MKILTQRARVAGQQRAHSQEKIFKSQITIFDALSQTSGDQ